MNGIRLKDLGYQIIDGLAGYYIGSVIVSSEKEWEYTIIQLNNGFNIRLCKWRRGSMPAYIILYKNGVYKFELDLSMLVYKNEAFTWYFKKKISNVDSREAVISVLGEAEELPEDYRALMLNNKLEAVSGDDTPANGYGLAVDMDIDGIVVKLGTVLDAVIKIHGGSVGDHSSDRRSNAKNDDVSIKQLRALTVRQGQGAFRQNLLNAYEECCAITGWSPVDVLDACHIESHSINGNNETANGILLRADLHNLFDKGLLRINHRDYSVEIDDSLESTEYWKLNNKKLKSKYKPALKYLKARYLDYAGE